MRVIPLAAVPNQSFSVRLDDTRMVLRIKEANGVMVADFERAGEQILLGARALAGECIIPYHYLEEGNFIFLTLNDELPAWQSFGVSQSLVYITAAEVAALRADPITVGEIDALNALPAEYLIDDDGFYLTDDNDQRLTAE